MKTEDKPKGLGPRSIASPAVPNAQSLSLLSRVVLIGRKTSFGPTWTSTCTSRPETIHKYTARGVKLAGLCSYFGHLCMGRLVPEFIIQLPIAENIYPSYQR